MRVVDIPTGKEIFNHKVEKGRHFTSIFIVAVTCIVFVTKSELLCTGDIWRMCQTKDVAIRDWVIIIAGSVINYLFST